MRQCARCTLNITESATVTIPLCVDCASVLGERPSPNHYICDVCCDRWYPEREVLCVECFKEEPVYSQWSQ